MDQFATNLNAILTACQPYSWVVAACSLFIIGLLFGIPSEKCHAVAQKALPFVIIGVLLMLGAVYIGKWITALIAFQ
jgi:hypothetical protein